MTCCCGTKVVQRDSEELASQPVPSPLVTRSVRVALGGRGLNAVNEPEPEAFYVIVGRGPMAVVNHSTLRKSDFGTKRIGEAKVLHLGFPNPWPKYLAHGLGQPNYLLSLPGFTPQNQPSAALGKETLDGGLNSQYFGACVDKEYAELSREFSDSIEPARPVWVALIQRKSDLRVPEKLATLATELGANGKRGGGKEILKRVELAAAVKWNHSTAAYRLLVLNPAKEDVTHIYATAIDICTGPGRPKVDSPDKTDLRALELARTPPWLPPETWTLEQPWVGRRVLNGVEAIHDDLRWTKDERICVTAGGGVGLNAAEKARGNKCFLDWFGRSGLMIPIFNNPRNLTFLRDPETGEPRAPGNRRDLGIEDEIQLLPTFVGHRLGRGAVLKEVSQEEGAGFVEVRLKKYPKFKPAAVIHDWDGIESGLSNVSDSWAIATAMRAGRGWKHTSFWTYLQRRSEKLMVYAPPSRKYDRLVIPNGQEADEVGQPISFAGHLGFEPALGKSDKRQVALQTKDGLVRVLGAAMNNYPKYTVGDWNRAGQPAVGEPKDVMWHYHSTLPVSAVFDGFIVCGANTAEANEFFRDSNLNVNTMSEAELRAAIDTKDIADRILNARHINNGYENIDDLTDKAGLPKDRTARDVLKVLKYEYS